MELMKVILYPDAIERFKRLYYPDLVRKDRLDSSDEIRQAYFEFLTKNKDLIIDLGLSNKDLELTFRHDDVLMPVTFVLPLPEELIQEFIHDPRIGLGFCTQCQLEYPIETGCTQTKRIYGKCHPKNFLPYLDKEGNKVFKGTIHYKSVLEWNPDEFIPHSTEIMKKNREIARKSNAELDKMNNPHLTFRFKEF